MASTAPAQTSLQPAAPPVALSSERGPWAEALSRAQAAWLLTAIVAVGAFLRVHGLVARAIWYDEGFTIAFSKKLGLSPAFLDTNVTSDAPLLPLLVRVMGEFFRLVPLTAPPAPAYDFGLRAIPCVLSIIAIGLCYWLARLILRNRPGALLTALLCAVSPFQVYYAQELKPYSLLLCISLAAMISLWYALERNGTLDWLALAFFLGIGMYGHLFAVWNIALANLYFALMLRRHYRQIPQWVATQMIACVMCLPMVLFAFEWTGIYERIQILWNEHPTYKTGFITFKTFFAGYGATAAVYWPLFVLCLGLALYGLWRLRHHSGRAIFIGVFTVVPIAANVIIWSHRSFPFYEHRIFILASTFAYMMAAWGILHLPRRWQGAVATGLILLLTFVCLRDYYGQRLHPLMSHRMGVRTKVANRDAAAYVSERMAGGDVVVHGSHFTYFPFLHYLPGVRQFNLRMTEGELKGFLLAMPCEGVWNAYGALPVMIDDAVRGARRVWHIQSWWEPNAIPPHVRAMGDWLGAHLQRREIVQFDGVSVGLYEAAPAGAR